MKPVDIVCHLTEYENLDELSTEDRNLVQAAKESASNAYAPYSHFLVGAAILLDNGQVIRGNNQENASYPIGLCAERVAAFSAHANFPGIGFKTVAVTAKSNQFSINKPVPPCGACRQAMVEYEHLFGKNIRVIMTGESGKILIADSVSALLPFQFTPGDLKNQKK
jgi:cytidine deaminase